VHAWVRHTLARRMQHAACMWGQQQAGVLP
jgi:hypothetical protein